VRTGLLSPDSKTTSHRENSHSNEHQLRDHRSNI
jgi:hypothetical protein